MNEFQKFVMHIRNLQAKGITQATFDVDYLCDAVENVSPLPENLKMTTVVKDDVIVIADGGGFGDDD